MKLKIASLLVLLMVTTAALAGNKVKTAVQIDTTNMEVTGTLGSARNSSSDTEYLFCNYRVDSRGKKGSCNAMNSEGVAKSCVTSDADLIGAIKLVSDSSFLRFKWDSDGKCTLISVSISSVHEQPTN